MVLLLLLLSVMAPALVGVTISTINGIVSLAKITDAYPNQSREFQSRGSQVRARPHPSTPVTQ